MVAITDRPIGRGNFNNNNNGFTDMAANLPERLDCTHRNMIKKENTKCPRVIVSIDQSIKCEMSDGY